MAQVEFKIFPSEGQWKINRDNEFVAVFSSQQSAAEAAVGYREEIEKNGGQANVLVVESDGSTITSAP
jgi:hypothetical protein